MLSDSDALARELLSSAQDALNAAAGDLTLALCALDAAGAVDVLTLARAVECEAEALAATIQRFEELRN